MDSGPSAFDLLDQIANELSDGLALCDLDGRVRYVNPPLRELLALDGELTVEDVQEVSLSEPNETTLRFRGAGEAFAECLCRVRPLGDGAGFAVIVRSETIEGKLVEARHRLIAIIESSDDAIVSKDLNGIVTSWNPAAEKIFGYTAQEMIGQKIQVLFPPDRLHEEDEILRRLRKGERVDHFETVRVAKDGRLLDVSVTISPVLGPSGRIIGASKVARVITERKLAEMAMRENAQNLLGLNAVLEQRVRERTAEIENAIREMEGFTYTISHDLRAPLRAIVANCRILEEDYAQQLPTDARSHFERQKNAALRMAQLIDDLLRLSRLSRQEMDRHWLDFSDLAQSVADEVSQDTGREFDAEIQPGMRAYGDETLLRLALANLVENAGKFARAGRPQVSVGEREGVYFVRDAGIGFDPKYAEKIFLPFERLHLEADYPGTGIGLANVKRIIERHGGQVWAEAEPGEGATFFFTLPPHRR